MMKFYDRKKEMDLLSREFELVRQKRLGRFVVVSGRRRVGKTSLLFKVAEENKDFVFVYLFAFVTTESNLAGEWMRQVVRALGLNFPPTFTKIIDVLRFLFELGRNRPIAIFIDECQDLTHVNPVFWAELQREWDLAKNSTQTLLVQSGSAASAMRLIFQDYSKPLFGRTDVFLQLRPFAPSVLQEILRDEKPDFSSEDLLLFYAVTGGVARYAEQFVVTGALGENAMIEEIFRDSSYFLTEAEVLLANDFKVESRYYSILVEAIARGVTKRAELQNLVPEIQVSGLLDRLQKLYGMIRKVEPLFNMDYRKVRYSLNDPYLAFWYAFVHRERTLLNAHQFEELKRRFRQQYADFSGRTLEGWFREKFRESGLYPQVGSWWDRKGENEIDLIAVNDERRIAWVFEIKRNPRKVDLRVLQSKANVMLASCRSLDGYEIRTKGLGMDDMIRPVEEIAPFDA